MVGPPFLFSLSLLCALNFVLPLLLFRVFLPWIMSTPRPNNFVFWMIFFGAFLDEKNQWPGSGVSVMRGSRPCKSIFFCSRSKAFFFFKFEREVRNRRYHTCRHRHTRARTVKYIYNLSHLISPFFLVHTVRVWPFSGAFHVRIFKKKWKKISMLSFLFWRGVTSMWCRVISCFFMKWCGFSTLSPFDLDSVRRKWNNQISI